MRTVVFAIALVVLSGAASASASWRPSAARRQETPAAPLLYELPLGRERIAEIERARRAGEYGRAAALLVEEAERDSSSPRANAIFAAAGGIFFLDGQYLNAVAAYRKAAALAPLDERGAFTLAMAYVKLDRRDLARAELEQLTDRRPRTALYLYWLARLDYDAQQYEQAITRFRQVIALDPQMVRAYDGLALCYDYLGRYDEALENFGRAIELNRRQARPSAWPHVNQAVALMAVRRLTEAEDSLREAIKYDARLPQAHYQLGQVLEKRGDYAGAITSLNEAARLDPLYPEPHYTLGRIHQRRGDKQLARDHVARFQRLRKRGGNSHLPPAARPQ